MGGRAGLEDRLHRGQRFHSRHDSKPPSQGFTDTGGKIVGSVRFPPANPDFAPFVQRIKDAKPEVVFISCPPARRRPR